MFRRLNSTGRRRIEAGLVAIAFEEGADPAAFTTTLDLESLDLPGEAKVVVEAYRGSLSERFDLGAVAALKPNRRFALDGFGADAELQFRVKVVEPVSGRLLATRDKVKPGDVEDSGRLPLLVVKEEDLGAEPWKIAFDEADGAVLLVNAAIPEAISRLKSAGAMQALILPAAFRQVLLRLWAEGEDLEADPDAEGWRQRWMRFAESLAGEELDDPEDRAGWIDKACRGFAERHPGMMGALIGEAG